MTRCPTTFDRYDCQTPSRLVITGSTIISPAWR